MQYTTAMTDLLTSLGDEFGKVYRYYLDRYFETLEEPSFKSSELRKCWYLLLTDGLVEEIRNGGKYRNLAKLMLRKETIYNSRWHECKAMCKPEPVIRTIKEAENGVKVLSVADKYAIVRDKEGRERKVDKDYIAKWCEDKGTYWAKEGFDVNYCIYQLMSDWSYEHRKVSPVNAGKKGEDTDD